jgi:hypothetical protein
MGDIERGVPMSRYKTLRTWSFFLIVLGAVSVVSASVGVLSWAFAVEGVWETLAVILFGAPIVLLLAAWPIALGQALRALADIGDAVTFDAPAAARSY